MKRARTFCFILLTLVAGHVMAGDTDIALPCAEFANKATGNAHYTLIGVIERMGFKRYRVWLNTENERSRVYCEIDNGEVSVLITEQGLWDSRQLVIPRSRDLAAR